MTISDRMVIMDRKGYIRQLGTPEEIWNHPSDRDVYTFLGVSNFIPFIREKDGFRLSLKSHLQTVEKLPIKGIDLHSKHFFLASRPMDIALTSPGGPGLQGIVERVTYLGNQFDYIVNIGGQQIRVQQDSLEAFHHGVPEEGAQRTVEFLSPTFYEADADDPHFVAK